MLARFFDTQSGYLFADVSSKSSCVSTLFCSSHSLLPTFYDSPRYFSNVDLKSFHGDPFVVLLFCLLLDNQYFGHNENNGLVVILPSSDLRCLLERNCYPSMSQFHLLTGLMLSSNPHLVHPVTSFCKPLTLVIRCWWSQMKDCWFPRKITRRLQRPLRLAIVGRRFRGYSKDTRQLLG